MPHCDCNRTSRRQRSFFAVLGLGLPLMAFGALIAPPSIPAPDGMLVALDATEGSVPVVEANLVAGQTPGVSGCVFNIATGQSVTVNAVLEESLRLTGMELAAIHEPQRPGDILHSRADISRARELLGWSSKVGLREGLQATLAWYQSII